MSMQPVLIEFDEPVAATVRLPSLGGSAEGEVTTIEVRPCGDMWVKMNIHMWERWRTQTRVGMPAVEGIGPGFVEIWAPGAAVTIDGERGPEVAAKMQAARGRA